MDTVADSVDEGDTEDVRVALTVADAETLTVSEAETDELSVTV